MRTVLAAALLLFLTNVAWAQEWSTPGGAPCTIIDGSELCIYELANTEGADSDEIEVRSSSAVFCLDSDKGATAIGAMRGVPRKCIGGSKPGSNPENECISVGGANGNSVLDGTEGPASTQNACTRVGPGVYYYDVTVACGAASGCLVMVQGEDEQ